MEVQLDKRYPLEVDAARAWQVLRDVRTVAGCMPGAAITEQIDDTHYKGSVKVKVGPANAAFSGDIEVLALEEGAKKLQLLGKGADRGGSSASMDLTATVEAGETPQTSVLVGKAAVIVNGKFAQFGGRLMGQVSDMLLAQFADNFRAAAAALPATSEVAGASAASSVTSASTGALDSGASSVTNANVAAATTATESTAATTSSASSSALPAPRANNELNALSLLWGLIKHWFASLFGKRAS